MSKDKIPPRLTEQEMQAQAVKAVQDFVNACNCKSRDDVLLALSVLLSTGLGAGEAVKHGRMEIVH
ncbi:hypothetical protein EYZ49_23640 [Salmonella enterica subsp. salamae serovar 13,22:z:-]|uniref:hypothetical protein n=1 Tax=Salmonella enterica TaxID=28901 RepID=UPI0010354BD5|nr:hypothetical protein [Salmonella enterica]TBN93365.1 hypothetical protein EYZ49_23640 [Salmonella enterica subsp. salamae serovar 13,22:z:-]